MKELEYKQRILDNLNRLKKYSDEEKLMHKNFRKELFYLMQELHDRDRNILDLNDLVCILVRKLYVVNNSLVQMEDYSKQARNTENTTDDTLQLEEENKKLNDLIKHAMDKLQALEAQAEQFLKEKEEITNKHEENLRLLKQVSSESCKNQDQLKTELKQQCDLINNLKQENITCQNELCTFRQNEQQLRIELQDVTKEHRNSLDEINQEKIKQEAIICELTCKVDELQKSMQEKDEQIEDLSKLVEKLKSHDKKHSKASDISLKHKKKKNKSDSHHHFGKEDEGESENSLLEKKKSLFDKTEREYRIRSASQLGWKSGIMSQSMEESDTSTQEVDHEAGELEIVIDQLSDSVHKMMSDSSRASSYVQTKGKNKRTNKFMMGVGSNETDNKAKEIQNLRATIIELEKALMDAQKQGANLQQAVQMYVDSIGMLEKSEEKAKLEVSQQRITILDLQKALVETKHQLEEYQHNTHQEIQKNVELIGCLNHNLTEIELVYKKCLHEFDNLSRTIIHLQNINLDQEVENFIQLQDILMLEESLKKYQRTSLEDQRCVCNLTAEIKRLRYEKENCLETISLLQNELKQCGNDLIQLQSILQTSAQIEDYNKELLCQLEEIKAASCQHTSSLQKELYREKQINHENAGRIEQLQNIVAQKVDEHNNLKSAYCDCKHNLDELMKENGALCEQLEQSQMANVLSEEQTCFCHQEINICLSNLQELKDKIRQETDLVNEKVLEYSQLQTVYNNQCCDIEILKRQIDMNKLYYKDEIIALKHQIRELTDKSALADCRCSQLQDELKEANEKLVECSNQEALMQQAYSQQESELLEKINMSQNEEIRLVEMTTQLKHELTELKHSIACKDKQLEAAKKALDKYKCECNQSQSRNQEEVNCLRNELNCLIQKHNALLEENGVLQAEAALVSNLKGKCKSLNEQLDQAFIQMQRISGEKECLIRRNEDLSAEIQSLYNTLNDMNNEYMYKTESVVMELVDTKQSRDALCHEGRNVIRNVRSWIVEQQSLNSRLKTELRDKKATISKLKKENEYLALSNRSQYDNQSMIPFRKVKNSKKLLSPPPPSTTWDLGSQGGSSSERDTPISSISTNIQLEWYEPVHDDDYDRPTTWVHRVESMTHDLQRSNQYWQSKLSGPDSMVSRDNF